MTKMQLECLTVVDSVLRVDKNKVQKLDVSEIRQYKDTVVVELTDSDNTKQYVTANEICQNNFVLVE